MKGRDVSLPIQWHEGMLLSPQHFQQFALRQDELLAYHALLLSPFHWGVRHLRVDPILLADGSFSVTELEAVMPDGLLVSYYAAEGEDLSLSLADHKDDVRERPRTIQLLVPAMRRAASLVRGEQARYRSLDSEGVVDLNTGEGEVRIPRLRPRLSLKMVDEVPARHVGIPLARVGYRDESFALTDYVPPSLEVRSGTPIGELCGAVATRVREKAIVLAEQLAARSASRGAPQLLHTQLMLHALVGELTRFEALYATGRAHPFSLYLALCSLVGHVSVVGSSVVPPVLEPYDHADPLAAFQQARTLIEHTLEEGIVEAFTPHVFVQREGAFSIHIDPSWLSKRLVLGVRGRAGASEEALDTWVTNALIGSFERIESIRQRRILGAQRDRFEGSDLIAARGVLLYELDRESVFIEPEQPLVILNLDDPGGASRPAEIVLYVRN